MKVRFRERVEKASFSWRFGCVMGRAAAGGDFRRDDDDFRQPKNKRDDGERWMN